MTPHEQVIYMGNTVETVPPRGELFPVCRGGSFHGVFRESFSEF